jgi:RNA-directed DNA polymerase
MGKRPAEVESFVGNMGSMQWEDMAFYAKRRIASHGNGLERIAAKARCEPKLRFTSLAHHNHEGAGVGESM